ncbi:hypothetical protein ET475_10065 [Microbacterium protaetiae]|uniref:Alpha/beta hydrolase domain-containing protein n=1 Tax=Microbacterium protaetiae TaxID=2509458 RepID=A0A4P6EDF9_9MICO|nr:alpha/beta hydrolase domain-containing protein [Microbacterium protaetiae]QAY60295.1 hypothetical protein ET475_10065 [Microbacterium protaetiae]
MNLSPAIVTPLDGGRTLYGSMYDAESGVGIDPTAVGYAEEEFLLSGVAGLWDTAAPGSPRRRDTWIRYRTRIVVRYPIDSARASGVTHVEPLHPHMDAGLTWDGLAAHLVRRGDAWMGVTVYPDVARLMREQLDPERYRPLLVPGGGTEWDILSDALEALRDGRLAALPGTRVILSGWSATGSFCRVFARERFAVARGGLVDAVGVFISSGGASSAGYPALSASAAAIDDDDPRRTVRDVGVPVFEILSETESETHRAQLREDSDDPDDTYRLYQLAGSAHIENRPGEWSTHTRALSAAGVDTGGTAVREARTDARSDLIMRALLDRLIEWVDGTPPPRAPRFEYAQGQVPVQRMLHRDTDGNVVGGIRSPWVHAPLAVYTPHGTPVDDPDSGDGPAWTPLVDRTLAAGLVGTMRALPAQQVRQRFPDESTYRRRFTDATHALVADRLLGAEDAADLIGTVPQRWAAAMREEHVDG